MSRIHDALKKASQERMASEGSPSPSSFVTPEAGELPTVAPLEEPQVAVDAGVPAGGVSGSPVIPSIASPFSLDALARCPQLPWKPDEKTMLFFNGEDNAAGTEQFRTLRSRLYHTREKMALKKILVTSALPKEGKSITSANLAQVLVRQGGHRVLLIDADLRGPRLNVMLGTTSSPGLSDYLRGGTDEVSIMQRGAMENLFFIPSGEQISDPLAMVANGRMKVLLERIEALFEWIIVDSPPALTVSDASVLAKACDGVLMVVRSDETSVDMVRRVREEFPDQHLIGVELNGADHESSPHSHYYFEAYVKDVTGSKS